MRAECQIQQEAIFFMKLSPSGSALSVLLYFTLTDVLTDDIPLKFNTFMEQTNQFL